MKCTCYTINYVLWCFGEVSNTGMCSGHGKVFENEVTPKTSEICSLRKHWGIQIFGVYSLTHTHTHTHTARPSVMWTYKARAWENEATASSLWLKCEVMKSSERDLQLHTLLLGGLDIFLDHLLSSSAIRWFQILAVKINSQRITKMLDGLHSHCHDFSLFWGICGRLQACLFTLPCLLLWKNKTMRPTTNKYQALMFVSRSCFPASWEILQSVAEVCRIQVCCLDGKLKGERRDYFPKRT